MHTLTLGEVAISRIVEIGRSAFPTTQMLPESDAGRIVQHHRWIKPHFFDDVTGDLGSRIQTWIVRTPRHTVLIDTGVGNDKSRHETDLLEQAAGRLPRRSARGRRHARAGGPGAVHAPARGPRGLEHAAGGRALGAHVPEGQVRLPGRGVGVLEARERGRPREVGLHRGQRGAGRGGGAGGDGRQRLPGGPVALVRAVGGPHARARRRARCTPARATRSSPATSCTGWCRWRSRSGAASSATTPSRPRSPARPSSSATPPRATWCCPPTSRIPGRIVRDGDGHRFEPVMLDAIAAAKA